MRRSSLPIGLSNEAKADYTESRRKSIGHNRRPTPIIDPKDLAFIRRPSEEFTHKMGLGMLSLVKENDFSKEQEPDLPEKDTRSLDVPDTPYKSLASFSLDEDPPSPSPHTQLTDDEIDELT